MPCTFLDDLDLPLFTAMAYLHILVVLLLFSLQVPGNSATAATRDTLSAGQALSIHDKLVSQNGRYALGFFETGNQIVLASLKSSKPYCPVVCGMEKDLTRRRKCQGTLVTCHL